MSDPLHSSILRAFRGRVGGKKPWLCDDDVVMLLVWMVQMPEYSHSYRSSCDLTFALPGVGVVLCGNTLSLAAFFQANVLSRLLRRR